MDVCKAFLGSFETPIVYILGFHWVGGFFCGFAYIWDPVFIWKLRIYCSKASLVTIYTNKLFCYRQVWDTSSAKTMPPLHIPLSNFCSFINISPIFPLFFILCIVLLHTLVFFQRLRASLCHSAALWCRTGSAKQLHVKLRKLFCCCFSTLLTVLSSGSQRGGSMLHQHIITEVV